MILKSEIGIIGAMYNVEEGSVEFFEDTFVHSEETLTQLVSAK